jgi:16S rRNA processing protein RimM
MADWDDMVLVGRIARPHGLGGHVVVDPETDFVTERFSAGERVWTSRGGTPTVLTIAVARLAGPRPIVGFAGCERREDAKAMAGLELRVPESVLQPLPEGRYYHHQLRGCVVETTTGDIVGTVAAVEAGVGDGCLVVAGAQGEVLVPLAEDICVQVDIAGGRIRIDPPEGLLELNAVAAGSRRRSRDLEASIEEEG